jgi:hypothetical protein
LSDAPRSSRWIKQWMFKMRNAINWTCYVIQYYLKSNINFALFFCELILII